MPELKTRQISTFLKAPNPKTPIVLFHGPDRGLSADRASNMADLLARNDTESILRLDGDALFSEPERLVEEAHAQNLFAPIRVIRVRDGVQSLLPSVRMLLAAPPEDVFVLIEAGELKRTAPLRKAVEASPFGVSIASYADSAQDIGRMVDDMIAAAGHTISPAARSLLIDHLGSDHAVSRTEIEKLLIYMRDKPAIEKTDVTAICGDSAATQIDKLVIAICSGQSEQIMLHVKRLTTSGTDLSPILIGLIRHFTILHKIAVMMHDGSNLADAMRGFRPPLHFRTQDAIKQHIAKWPTAATESALSNLQETVLATRRDNELGAVFANRTLLRLAEVARRGAPQKRSV